MRLVGYSDRLSVAPGETIAFKVSCAHAAYRADVVRLVHGDPNPRGPGFVEVPVATPVSGEYPGRVQAIATGSHVAVPNHPVLQLRDGLTVQAWILPTTPAPATQGLVTKWSAADGAGFALVLEAGEVAFWVADGDEHRAVVRSGAPVRAGDWYFVAATFDAASGQIAVVQHPLSIWPRDATRRDATVATDLGRIGETAAPVIMAGIAAGGDRVDGHFNGKLDRPRLFDRALTGTELGDLEGGGSPRDVGDALVAAWEFGRDVASARVVDGSPNGLHGTAVNLPARAVTGANWTGGEVDFRRAPDQYGAIHFHDDDLEDAGWATDFALTVPDALPSGVYAARLRAGGDEDHLPFVVRPRRGTATAPIAYLIPTFTYLAYANEHLIPEPLALFPFADLSAHAAEYRYIAENRLHSLYDCHRDGSGVRYASWKRPLVNLRPKAVFRIYGAPERLGADLYLTDWLERQGFAYDAVADENLHAEGVALLARYRVVVTGTHPEYWTGAMLDALEAYLTGGGRVMYLGGNGFYWVTGVDPARPHVIEVRRWRGTETWEADPGEVHLSTTGERGGLWRHRNRAPQKQVGVGFTSQGNDLARPYVRQPASFAPRTAWIFDGIGDDEAIGDVPSLMLRHGAAGYEIDRADGALGTPPHAAILATATGFSDSYQHVVEEILATDGERGGTVQPLVRADMVYVEGPNGGAVFSVGSIAWCGALSANGDANTVSRITGNVLRRFAAAAPIA